MVSYLILETLSMTHEGVERENQEKRRQPKVGNGLSPLQDDQQEHNQSLKNSKQNDGFHRRQEAVLFKGESTNLPG